MQHFCNGIIEKKNICIRICIRIHENCRKFVKVKGVWVLGEESGDNRDF